MIIKQNIASFIRTQKHKTIISESDIDHVFESIYSTIISSIQKYLWKKVQIELLIQS